MRADRLLSILLLLQARGRMTARDLAEELEVSERTIYRDFDALSMAGVPVVAERGPGGGCMLLEGYQTNLTGLTEDEAQALFLAGLAGPLADLGLGKAAEAVMLKLAAAIPAIQVQAAERMRKRIHLDSAEWFATSASTPHLATIQEALWQSRRLQITYATNDGQLIGLLCEPYGLVAKGGIWYLVAAPLRRTLVVGVAKIKPARREIRVYRVSRMQSVELTEESFEFPADFDLSSYWTEWSARFEANMPRYTVTLRIAQIESYSLTLLFGEDMHGRMRQLGEPDDQGWVTITLDFESPESAIAHTLGMGTLVEIVATAELRERVLDSATRLVAQYRAGSREPGDELRVTGGG